MQLQIEDLTRKLRTGDLGIPPNPEDRSGPPPPAPPGTPPGPPRPGHPPVTPPGPPVSRKQRTGDPWERPAPQDRSGPPFPPPGFGGAALEPPPSMMQGPPALGVLLSAPL